MSAIARHQCDRALVVGDLHGERALLEQLLQQVDRGRQLVFVGDLCDRGSDTKGLIDLLLERRAVGVRGNHDDLFARALAGDVDAAWLHPSIGGRATLRSYGVLETEIATGLSGIPASHRRFIETLPIALDLEVAGEQYWVVHAGLPTDVSLDGVTLDQVVAHLATHKPDVLLWPMSDPETSLPVGRCVISGHATRDAALVTDDAIAVDVRGALTGILLPERRLVAVARPR